MDGGYISRRGFSLVEMLVVLSIIGVMLALSAPMWMTQSTMDLNGASMRLATFFEEARAQSTAYGEPVRVLIHDDPTDPGNYRRRILALRREDKDSDDATPPQWRPVLHPLILPEGIFIDVDQPGVSQSRMSFTGSGAENLSWRYYEIEPSGVPSEDSARNVVLGKGIADSPGSQIRFPNPELVAGFRLSNRTRPIHFRNRDDIARSTR
ncbi:MAG: prepilin-type N-terminal cleavage/methylation domain-containing protein [Verrucomicrobiae bacterium]|nr:prepilin-type N-terminal cleavage/methylation domain-containing protein [Verrucomicrobiae bacterium]